MAATNQEKYVLYGHAGCPSCSTIKSFFKANELEYTYVDIHTDKGMMAYEADFPGARSVPRIVVIGKTGFETKLEGAKAIMEFFK